jgi:polysaccharide deacetylase family protein (PEP-CTERM system associated)
MEFNKPIVNALSIDVEDYFQVAAFAGQISITDWDRCESRVERNVDLILDLLADYETKATFFTLGWIGDRYPNLVRRIVHEGHELASHGYSHQKATLQSSREFSEDITRAKSALEDIGGIEVKGYRAPSFSIGSGNMWALECIEKAGYKYSSSIYPVKHDHYGLPDFPRFPLKIRSSLVEIPISTTRFFNRNWPVGGGGFFRLFPYQLSRWGLRRVNQVDGKPAIFYFHPWEVDPDQPRVPGVSRRSKFRHYLNLNRTESRLRRLLSDFRWGRADEIFL